MRTAVLDLDALAAELGISRAAVNAHIRAAVAAGLLRVREVDDDLVRLEAVVPDHGEPA